MRTLRQVILTSMAIVLAFTAGLWAASGGSGYKEWARHAGLVPGGVSNDHTWWGETPTNEQVVEMIWNAEGRPLVTATTPPEGGYDEQPLDPDLVTTTTSPTTTTSTSVPAIEWPVFETFYNSWAGATQFRAKSWPENAPDIVYVGYFTQHPDGDWYFEYRKMTPTGSNVLGSGRHAFHGPVICSTEIPPNGRYVISPDHWMPSTWERCTMEGFTDLSSYVGG